jgi:hypothetical protein
MIEEGDTTSLTEVVQLCDAIGIAVASVLPEGTKSLSQGETALTIMPASRKAVRQKRDGRLSG